MVKAVSAAILLLASLPTFSQTGKDAYYSRQARVLFEQERFQEAATYADSAIAGYTLHAVPDSVVSMTLLRADIHKARRNFEKALADQRAAQAISDSLSRLRHRAALEVLVDSILQVQEARRVDSIRLTARMERSESIIRRGMRTALNILV